MLFSVICTPYLLFFFSLLGRLLLVNSRQDEVIDNLFRIEYPFNEQLLHELREFDTRNLSNDLQLNKLYTLAAKITNEHNALLINDRSQQLFEDILYFLGDRSPRLKEKVCHILSVITFSNGNFKQVSI
jgi:hypothetical protein